MALRNAHLWMGLALLQPLFFGQGAPGHTLARDPSVGALTRYRLTVEVDSLGASTLITALITEKIVSVEGGRYTVESTQTEGKARSGELEAKLPDSKAERAVYLVSGEPASIQGENERGIRGRLARLNAFVAPGKAIQVGDKWSHTFAPTTLSGGIGAKTDYRLSALEKVGTLDSAVIEFTCKETSGDKPAQAQGKAWIATTTGELLKLESAWKNAPLMSADAPMDAKVSLIRES